MNRVTGTFIVAVLLVGLWGSTSAFAAEADYVIGPRDPIGVEALRQAIQAAEADYVIGPEDVLQITVWDNKDLEQAVFVRPDGKISVPLAGEIQAAGLTVAQLNEVLAQHFSKSVKSPLVTVIVREIRSRAMFFVGGVGKPGPLQVTRELSLLQAISLVGGLVPAADLEASYMVRGKKKIPLNFVELVKNSDLARNIRVQPGDTVVVPLADVVYVLGEVKSPGERKYTKDLTILKAIVQSGGFTGLASSKRVTVIRENGGKKVNLRVDVNGIMKNPDEERDIPLEPNDIIIVPERLF